MGSAPAKAGVPGCDAGALRDLRRRAALVTAVALLAAPLPAWAAEEDERTAPEDDAPRALQTVVTGVRTARPQREAPNTVTVLSRRELERNPALTTDVALRSVPSAQTFRRSASLSADPSSQGVNLRGLAPSAISRTLVLLDGLPMNDAFGGWVYWRALPRLGLQRIEIAQGGSSAQYGNAALGGVIQLISRDPDETSVDADVSGGSLSTGLGAVRASLREGRLAGAIEGEVLTSRGHLVVASGSRGPIDRAADSRHLTGDARLRVAVKDDLELRFRARGFDEAQNGGTALTTAQVWTGQLSVGARLRTAAAGHFDLDAFAGRQRLYQERARVLAVDGVMRAEERLSTTQSTPSNDLGAALVWTGPMIYGGGRHHLSAGADLRTVRGEARERFVQAGGERISGGSAGAGGAFVQDLYRPSPGLDVLGAVRIDGWSTADGRQLQIDAAGVEDETHFDARSGLQLSPRLGARYAIIDPVAIRANVYRAFRAPTLNELYRPFQVGTVVTANNPELRPETVVGGELGVELQPVRTLQARLTGFWNELDAPIVNVTLEAPLPGGATRQKRNLGRARVRGAELEAEWRLHRTLTAIAGYTYLEPVVTEHAQSPELVGRDLPQDPRHRLSVQLAFEHPRYLNAAVFSRYASRQFEDDLNLLPMEGYAVFDAVLSRELLDGLSAFAAVENLLDTEYLVGRAGVDTVGAPRTFRLGLRFRSR